MSTVEVPTINESSSHRILTESLAKTQISITREYPPLRPDQKEFRLLKIRPSLEPISNTISLKSTSMQCDLFVASRDNPPDYQALSYTWGNPNETVPIQVNGITHQITQNLRTALEYIRQENEDVVIWVDAVCIDQNNHQEKSEQVTYMAEIYASAKCTIVWLGLPDDRSDQFIRRCIEIGGDLSKPKTVGDMVIPNISDLMTELNLLQAETVMNVERSNNLERMADMRIASFIDKAQQDVPSALSFLTAFQKLLSRDYWSRVWVLQEFVVSSYIVMQCGRSKVGLLEFRATSFYCLLMHVKLMRKYPERLQEAQRKSTPDVRAKISRWITEDYPEDNDDPDIAEVKRITKEFSNLEELQNPKVTIFGMRRRYQELGTTDGHHSLTLMRILASVFVGGTAEATMEKDRIFSMLGMASDKKELGLLPNYDERISVIDVYTATARAIITTGNVDLLSFSQHRQPPATTECVKRIPSWVPDWGNPIARPSGQLPWDTAFAASGNECFEKPVGISSYVDSHLVLYGWMIDTIEGVSPAWIDPDERPSENEHNTTRHLADISTLCKASDDKFRSADRDIYSQAADRKSAHFLIPVADQELSSARGCRRAGEGSREAYSIVVDGSLKMTTLEKGNEVAMELRLKSACYVEVMRYQKFRRPFLAVSGYVGLAPESVKQGDVLVIFRGAKFPYVLRRNGEGTYILVGEAYVHGIMYGEYLESPREAERFILQ
jgi:hypothetical protein